MLRSLAVAVLVGSLTASVPALAVSQQQQRFGKDAAKLFYVFAEFSNGFEKGGLAAFERFAKTLNLSASLKDEAAGWAIYEGQNESGTITASAFFPDPATKKNSFSVEFTVAAPAPMSEALLSHLLSKAETTDLSNGDEIELRFSETSRGACLQRHTLKVRLTTGALLSHSATTTCPVH